MDSYQTYFHTYVVTWKEVKSSVPSNEIKQVTEGLGLNLTPKQRKELKDQLQSLLGKNLDIKDNSEVNRLIEGLDKSQMAVDILDGSVVVGRLTYGVVTSLRSFSIASKVLLIGNVLSKLAVVTAVLSVAIIPVSMILKAIINVEQRKNLEENIKKIEGLNQRLDNHLSKIQKSRDNIANTIDLMTKLFPAQGGKSWKDSMSDKTAALSDILHGSNYDEDKIINECVSHIRVLNIKKEVIETAVNDYMAKTTEYNQKFYQPTLREIGVINGEPIVEAEKIETIKESVRKRSIRKLKGLIDQKIEVEENNSFSFLERRYPKRSRLKTRANFDQYVANKVSTEKSSNSFSADVRSFKRDTNKMNILVKQLFSQEITTSLD
ncbi:MAG: hypothetical protein F6K23_02960 [Okeania sp. SIO2C9]|uniref:hypothetical protein n=1 Tax=Okeania sp. SIO2C9 TaxID=2607791 RepID=UPI0013C1A83A|nr:hypothetical protein [Okeania sp. SIO2C9]NEQ72123.1 hypothetical protein [Okeania sp. SIO2C9]